MLEKHCVTHDVLLWLWLHNYIPTLSLTLYTFFLHSKVPDVPPGSKFSHVSSSQPLPALVQALYKLSLSSNYPHSPFLATLATVQPANGAIQQSLLLTEFSAVIVSQGSPCRASYSQLSSPWPLYLVLCISSHARGALCSMTAQDGWSFSGPNMISR